MLIAMCSALLSGVAGETNETLTANRTIELQSEALSKLENLLDEYQTILYRLELKTEQQKNMNRNWNYDSSNGLSRPDPFKTKYTPDEATKQLRHIDVLFPYYEHFINDTESGHINDSFHDIQQLLTLKIDRIDQKLTELKAESGSCKIHATFLVGLAAPFVIFRFC